MQATQIFFPERNKVALETITLPPLGPHDVLVRTEVSLISAGTELTNLLGDREDQPFPKYPGYSNVGVVERMGDQVADFAVGDRVLSNGRHASHHIVSRATKRTGAPQTLLRVPEGVDPADATFTTLGAVAMHGIRKAEPKLGANRCRGGARSGGTTPLPAFAIERRPSGDRHRCFPRAFRSGCAERHPCPDQRL